MASKMPTARDLHGQAVSIVQAEAGQYQKPLCCLYCDAEVVLVRGHTRQVGDTTVKVQSFFRLNVEHEHSPECRFNTAGQIKIIARASEGDLFAALSSNRYELRLLSLRKVFDELRQLSPNQINALNEPIGLAKEKIYVSAETKLGAYINSAKRVLNVRAACESHADIEQALTLVFDGTRIPWKDFYFDDADQGKDFFRCYRQHRQATVDIPLAIQGTVLSIRSLKNDLFVMNLAKPMRKVANSDTMEVVQVSIWSKDPNAFADYKQDQSVVAFGMWNSSEPKITLNSKVESSIKKFVNHDLRLWPLLRSQVCHG
jgi:hypothetical protein